MQVLRVRWDVDDDTLIFDVSEVCQAMKEAAPTKRNAVMQSCYQVLRPTWSDITTHLSIQDAIPATV